MRSVALRFLMMVWFGLLAAEPPMLADHCPIHDPIAAAAAAVAAPAVDGHAAHQMHHAQQAHQGHQHSGSAHHTCSCRGMCCDATVAGPVSATTVAIAPVTLRAVVATPVQVAVARAAFPHSLPPSTAPPALLASGFVRI